MDIEIDQTEAAAIEPCWPFWGMLKSFESGRLGIAGRPDRIRKTIILVGATPDFFQRFDSIGWKALGMLEHRSIDDLRNAAQEIWSEIEENRNWYVNDGTESLIKDLVKNGGYQSHYLPYGSHGTEDEYRHLLENWSADFDDLSGLPKSSDMSELDALSDYLDGNKYDKSSFFHLGLIEPEEHEFYAVLTLMIICDAVHSTPPRRDYREPESVSRVLAIGTATINAMDALAYAERIKFEAQIRNSIAAAQPAILAAEVEARSKERDSRNKKRLSEAGAKGAKAKNEATDKLKCWALAKAADMRDQDIDIARKLAAQIPSHLADVSKNAERLIYDALRTRSKSN